MRNLKEAKEKLQKKTVVSNPESEGNLESTIANKDCEDNMDVDNWLIDDIIDPFQQIVVVYYSLSRLEFQNF